nr:hypothetical protein [Tanacetum cinerariifolium]
MDQDSAYMVAAFKVPMLKPVMPITNVEEKAQRRLEVLQKLVSQLELLGEKLSQEDVNQKLLRSLSPEWNTHVVMWRNKADLDTMSMYDLYNNLSNTNEAVNTDQAFNTTNGFYAARTQVNGAFSINIDNLNDDVICAFLASLLNSHQLADEDLEQIYPYDIEEMDLRWQMAMLTMRARRFLKKNGRKLNVNGNETLSFDMSKVECYNCHKRGHFSRECRALRNQDNKHKENIIRSVLMETPAFIALVSCDGLGGYDWSDQAEEGPNYALMAYTYTSFESKIVDNCKKGLGYENYNAVLHPYTGNFIPPKSDLSFTGLDEFVNKPVVENYEAKFSENKLKVVRKNNDALIIKDLVLDNEEEEMTQPKIMKKIVKPSIHKIEFVKPRQ